MIEMRNGDIVYHQDYKSFPTDFIKTFQNAWVQQNNGSWFLTYSRDTVVPWDQQEPLDELTAAQMRLRAEIVS